MSKSQPSVFFYITSYAWEAGYKPSCIMKLTDILIDHKDKEKKVVYREPYHAGAIQNALEKLGYMFLARNKIKEIESNRLAYGRFHVHIIYHAWNFLIACKACLDAISGLLNKEYELGYEKGQVDLKHNFFFDKLERKNEELWERIGEYREWIKEISMSRDHFIHRHGLIAVPSGTDGDTAYLLGKLVFRKPDGSMVDWWEFCQTGMTKITKLFEMVCEDLIDRRKR